MKVVVSSTGDILESQLDPRFGRCSKFIIFDSDSKAVQVLINPAAEADHGAGTLAAQKVVDINADSLITGHVGQNAYMVLKAAGVKVYECNGKTVKEALDMLEHNQLTEIKSPNPHKAKGEAGNRARHGAMR